MLRQLPTILAFARVVICGAAAFPVPMMRGQYTLKAHYDSTP
jgi:hypothetical protein